MSTYAKDLIERTVSTYAVTFLGIVIAAWGNAASADVLSIAQTAALAAIPAALTVLKSGLAKFVGNSDSASFTV